MIQQGLGEGRKRKNMIIVELTSFFKSLREGSSFLCLFIYAVDLNLFDVHLGVGDQKLKGFQ